MQWQRISVDFYKSAELALGEDVGSAVEGLALGGSVGTSVGAAVCSHDAAASFHVHEAACFGNCWTRGTSVADFDLARASRRVIISCERLIENDEIRNDPTSTVIPFFCVDAVCEVPFGSYPGNIPAGTPRDDEYFAAQNAAKVQIFYSNNKRYQFYF